MGRFRPPNCFGRERLPGDSIPDGLRDRTFAQCHGHAPLFRRRSRQESRVVVQGQTEQGIGRRGHFAGSFLAHALDEFFQPGACRQLPGHGLVSTGCSDSHRLLHRWQWNEWAIPPPLRPDLRSGKRWEIGRSTAAELAPSRRDRLMDVLPRYPYLFPAGKRIG
jgi:hypothetical protein